MENGNKVKGKIEYGTSNTNNISSKNQLSECQMETREYLVKVNENGNHEITRYNTSSKFEVTVEFLGTGDEKEIADSFVQMLKGNFIKRNLIKSIDSCDNGEYNPQSKEKKEV